MNMKSNILAGPSIRICVAISLAIFLLLGLSAKTGEPQFGALVAIDWNGKKFRNLSGVSVVGKFLVVADAESEHSVHVLESRGGGYRYLDNIKLSKGEDELDLEGIACEKNIVYVIGSHSRNSDNERQEARERVYRFELDSNGKPKGAVAETRFATSS